jgi:hypothetical protein
MSYMPNEWFLVYLTIATIYGWLMYRMGRTAGIQMIVQELVNVGLVKSFDAMNEKIDDYYASKQEEN